MAASDKAPAPPEPATGDLGHPETHRDSPLSDNYKFWMIISGILAVMLIIITTIFFCFINTYSDNCDRWDGSCNYQRFEPQRPVYPIMPYQQGQSAPAPRYDQQP